MNKILISPEANKDLSQIKSFLSWKTPIAQSLLTVRAIHFPGLTRIMHHG